MRSLFYLYPKYQAYSILLCLCSSVCVGPVQKPHCWVFPRGGSNISSLNMWWVQNSATQMEFLQTLNLNFHLTYFQIILIYHLIYLSGVLQKCIAEQHNMKTLGIKSHVPQFKEPHSTNELPFAQIAMS